MQGQQEHRVINGRVYRTVNIEAADTRAASQHVMAQQPTPESERRALHSFIASTKSP